MYGEREHETIVDVSDQNNAEASIPTTAVEPDGVQPESHRGSLVTGIAASNPTAPGKSIKIHQF